MDSDFLATLSKVPEIKSTAGISPEISPASISKAKDSPLLPEAFLKSGDVHPQGASGASTAPLTIFR